MPRWQRMREAGKQVLTVIGGVAVLFLAYFLVRGTPKCYQWDLLARVSTPAPCPGSPEEISALRKQIAQLQSRTEEEAPKLQVANFNLKRLEKFLGATAQALERQNESLQRDNAALRRVVRRLRQRLQEERFIPMASARLVFDEGLSRGDPGGDE